PRQREIGLLERLERHLHGQELLDVMVVDDQRHRVSLRRPARFRLSPWTPACEGVKYERGVSSCRPRESGDPVITNSAEPLNRDPPAPGFLGPRSGGAAAGEWAPRGAPCLFPPSRPLCFR